MSGHTGYGRRTDEREVPTHLPPGPPRRLDRRAGAGAAHAREQQGHRVRRAARRGSPTRSRRTARRSRASCRTSASAATSSKNAGAWALEKVGRLKLNGELTSYSPLSRVVELEGLAHRDHRQVGPLGRAARGGAARAAPRRRSCWRGCATAPRSSATTVEELREKAARRGVRRVGSPPCRWEPELEELRRREELARRMGGEERVERQHASGRLTVRERIERLFDAGTLPRDRRARRARHLRRRRRADRLPARQHGRRPGPHRRPPRGRAGRRLHGPRRRGRRRDLGEGGLRRADGARPAAPARPARRRHRRRRQRQVARGHGLLLRAAAARLRPGRAEPVDRAGRRRGARAGGGPRRRARGVLALLGDRARTPRSCSWPGRRWWRPAWARRPTRRSSAARACRRAPARSTTWPPTRTTRSTSSSASSPTCPQNVWEAPPVEPTRPTPPTAARRSSLSIVPRDPRQPYKMRRVLEAVLDRGSVFELGAAFGRPTITCLARLGGRPVGRARLRPRALRRRRHRGRLREDRPLRRHVRPVPPAGRELRRPARAS